MGNTGRLRQFVRSFTRLVDSAGGEEQRVFDDGRPLLAALITHDDWLPAQFGRPHADRYQQYLLYCDPWERFSVVSFVWGPGQKTPVHDHTVWGMVGVLRGLELCEEFSRDSAGGELYTTGRHEVTVGDIDLVSPRVGDIHRVSNALTDRESVSIHVYGANIGAVRRHVFDVQTGQSTEFISGYSGDVMPNIWDRSQDPRGA
jgi:predicted metal-dependent enzyme (double-stranded beta helix superfamily)